MARHRTSISLSEVILEKFGVIAVMLYFLFWIIMILGYICNIVKLAGAAISGEEFTLLLVLRIIGVFAAPLGSILGFI